LTADALSTSDPVTDAAPVRPTMTIDGKPVSTTEELEVINPATGAVAGYSPSCTADQLDAAFEAAQAAFPAWRALGPERRGELLRASADILEREADALGNLLTTEMGRPWSETRFEARQLVDWLRHFAGMTVPPVVIRDDDQVVLKAVRRPLGVVAAITPWNGPLGTLGMKIGPALSAGNTVVVKPSPAAPLSTLRIGELLRDVLPPGVLSVVAGPDALGAAFSQHPVPRKVTFSGSIGVGKKIALGAAGDLKRLTLELGGNDAAVVLDDSDPVATAKSIFRFAFGNCGQACVAIKRVYATPGIYGRLVELLAEAASAAVVGDPLSPTTQLGPLIDEAQLRRMEELIADATARGARVAAGGERLAGPGYFFQPTIIADAAEGMRVVDEEQFGPVLPVIACADLDDAITRANATEYALGASIWTADPEAAHDAAERLEAGSIWINTHRITLGPSQPLGGWKWSGIGVENGPWGLESFTQLQAVLEQRPVPAAS
jgi:acyl-CoA reductase-like NAD-dependent aldehyde dehydrogenase